MKFTPFFQIYGIIIALKGMFVNCRGSHGFLNRLIPKSPSQPVNKRVSPLRLSTYGIIDTIVLYGVFFTDIGYFPFV